MPIIHMKKDAYSDAQEANTKSNHESLVSNSPILTNATDPLAETWTEVNRIDASDAAHAFAKLANNSEALCHVRLGGVLAKIRDNEWYGVHDSFKTYCSEELGIGQRSAQYLIQAYSVLKASEISWGELQGVGWSKIKILCARVSAKEIRSWLPHAKNATCRALREKLEAASSDGGQNSPIGISTMAANDLSLTDTTKSVATPLDDVMSVIGSKYANAAVMGACSAFMGLHGDTVDSRVFQRGIVMTWARKVGKEEALKTIEEAFTADHDAVLV